MTALAGATLVRVMFKTNGSLETGAEDLHSIRKRTRKARNKMMSTLRAFALAILFGSLPLPVLAQSSLGAARDAAPSPPPPIAGQLAAQPAPAVEPSAPSPEEKTSPDLPPTNHVEQRARLRACAEKWQRMKETGADLGMTWRDFSTTCLAQ